MIHLEYERSPCCHNIVFECPTSHIKSFFRPLFPRKDSLVNISDIKRLQQLSIWLYVWISVGNKWLGGFSENFLVVTLNCKNCVFAFLKRRYTFAIYIKSSVIWYVDSCNAILSRHCKVQHIYIWSLSHIHKISNRISQV